jgi:cell wall assembly regulator SMI1
MLRVLGLILAFVVISSCVSENENDNQDRERQFEMTYHEERSLVSVYESILDIHRNRHPKIFASMKASSSLEADSDVKALEALTKSEMPEEFVELYSLTNGQVFDSPPFFFGSYELMSLDRISEAWKMLNKVYLEGKFVRSEGEAQSKVKDLWWHPKWIPIAENFAGDMICVDLFPSDTGTHGQVIEFIHDDTPRKHLGNRIVDFLGEYEQGLRSGKYEMHPEWKVIVDTNKLENESNKE